METLTATELATIIQRETIEQGESPTLRAIRRLDYKYEPVDPHTFLFDPYFMGTFCKGETEDGIKQGGLYDQWANDLKDVLDPLSNYMEWILTGAIGTGKSFSSSLALAYKIYCISCLKDPAGYYNLVRDSKIVFGVYSLFRYKAKDDNYAHLKLLIENCPYFRECFPTKKMRNRREADNLEFDHNISVIAGSDEFHALGNNLFALLIDEMNFMKGDGQDKEKKEKRSQARELYTASRRRLTSRFSYRGIVPGLLILISSRRVDTSWLDGHIEESKIHYPDVTYISDHSIWKVKRDVMGYSGETFSIEVGDAFHSSRILESEDKVRDGARVISDVPVEHRKEFQTDIDGALRDLAGVASLASSPLIRHRDTLRRCIHGNYSHPFKKQSVTISTRTSATIQEYLNLSKCVRIVKSIAQPRINPGATRAIHIDLSRVGDAAGFCMGHVSAFDGASPIVQIDMMLQILPPIAGEIDFSKIREFVVYLRDQLNYPIKVVNYDGFQSADSIQTMKKLGFHSKVVSIDRDDKPYLVARSMLSETRLVMYSYPPFISEVVNLMHDEYKRKVDHKETSTKDVADAWAGVCFTLSTMLGEDKQFRSNGEILQPSHIANANIVSDGSEEDDGTPMREAFYPSEY